MHTEILLELQKIERSEGVRVLYACESGNRAWGFASDGGGCDVRFIYAHPTEWYLSVDEGRDVLGHRASDLLDISGWDIRKALQLFRKSNPPLLEWLGSPTVYLEKYSLATKMQEASQSTFNPRTCLYHYLHMAEDNYRAYLQDEEVQVMKYLYVLRPILACKWIEMKRTIPPVNFKKLFKELLLYGPVSDEIEKLLARRKLGEKVDCEPRIAVLHDFLEEKIRYYLEHTQVAKKQRPLGKDLFDRIFRETLNDIWGQNYRLTQTI